ncbi:MAG: hypothetical protein AMXMBFR84_20420 [Candidatus Hydrogenedentota bacterium]
MEQNGKAILQFIDGPSLPLDDTQFTPQERVLLNRVNQRVAGGASLAGIMNFVFDSTRDLFPCDRIGLAFVEDDGHRVVSYWARALYAPIRLDKGYVEDLQGSSLEVILKTGQVRIIHDLSVYLAQRPNSNSTRLLVDEGVRSSMTCPLLVDGRSIGFLFRSSRKPFAYDEHQVCLHLALAERLSQAIEKAYRIEQLTSVTHGYREMLAFISHELKNPLASLAMDATVLAGGYLGPLEEKQASKIEGMKRKAEHVLGLVRDYLTLARIEDPAAKAEFVVVGNMEAAIIAPAVELVRSDAEAKGMQITIQPSDDRQIACACDLELLKIAVVNLLSNAVKYGSDGGEVRISTKRMGNKIELTVWNEGVGFSKDQRSRLFRKFSRLDSPEARHVPGTGVGLYTAWRIARMHDACIDAESEEGAWASFTLSIPQNIPTSALQALKTK